MFTLEAVPTEETLKGLLGSYPLNEAEEEHELGQIILPMSLNRFFQEFIDQDASFGFDVFSRDICKHTDI